MKRKILGMALLAAAATSAFAVVNASAVVPANSHFYHHAPTTNAWITGHEASGTLHQLKFYRLNAGSHTTIQPPIECEQATYTATVTTRTVSPITMTPHYTKCKTEGGTPDEVKVDVNGCDYTFSPHGANKHGTVRVDCPAGKAIEITHPNCTTKIPAQIPSATTLTEGINYTPVEEGGVKALTADVTVRTITGHLESGLCVFLGTNWKFEMVGSVTVKGYEDLANGTQGAQIPITHT
jgi:hypothetical protein